MGVPEFYWSSVVTLRAGLVRAAYLKLSKTPWAGEDQAESVQPGLHTRDVHSNCPFERSNSTHARLYSHLNLIAFTRSLHTASSLLINGELDTQEELDIQWRVVS